jgi:DNA helicase-2/ATP-dependent DNA helicase PcrA
MATLRVQPLTADQQAAVDCRDRAILVSANAGCGKTEVVVRRVERLLAEAPDAAFRVLAVSYTVKAADEMDERFVLNLGDMRRRVDANTLHGFAHALLRQHGTQIGLPLEPEVLTRDEDRVELLSRWLQEDDRELQEEPGVALRGLDLARARLLGDPGVADWSAALASVGALDYAAMLEKATELLALPSVRRQVSRLYQEIVVDEAQNLTPAQYRFLVAAIGPPSGHMPTTMVGDGKQSIVGFAGADPALMERFARDSDLR